jgi:hypothetical protein
MQIIGDDDGGEAAAGQRPGTVLDIGLGWPRPRNRRVCRPPPAATSSTVPPAGTRSAKRATQADGADISAWADSG